MHRRNRGFRSIIRACRHDQIRKVEGGHGGESGQFGFVETSYLVPYLGIPSVTKGLLGISGLKSKPGYCHHATFWRDDLPKDPCPHCLHRHSLSLHGVHAHCTPSHPLVEAWLTAWQRPPPLQSWRHTANRRDLRIMARLAIPQSLYRFLCSNLGGLRAARSAVMSFQQKVIDTVNLALATDAPFPPPRRPCPFNIADWRVSPEQ